jgi:hypothetical protein
MVIVSSMMVASMMMASMVEAVKEMRKEERFGLPLASPYSRCLISPAAVRPR